MIPLELSAPWLTLHLGAPHRVLSWSITAPGFVNAERIIWREVRNADLPTDLDVPAWYKAQLGASDVGFLTSRNINAHHQAVAMVDGVQARAVATVGLSNAERVGTRLDRSAKDWGTINIAVQLGTGLSDAAMIEALSIATQARTAAVIDAGYDLPTGRSTGTGTDCIAIACPEGDTPYAGLHTAVGEAIGRAVYDAVQAGAEEWMRTTRREGEF